MIKGAVGNVYNTNLLHELHPLESCTPNVSAMCPLNFLKLTLCPFLYAKLASLSILLTAR